MTDPFTFHPGSTPLLVSIPHDGWEIPDDITARLTPEARHIPDTDWHVRRLYAFAAGMGAGVLAATQSRYVVDLNRDPSGEALYPGADNTEIVPLTTFDREPIYLPDEAPDAAEVAARIETWWRPYHARLAEELAALRKRHGVAVLFDAHSIRSQLPRFFDGTIPDFNHGTARGASADKTLAARAFAVLSAAEGYTAADNRRFTGGYITRHYGDPRHGVHAVQLELSQRTYMDEAWPFDFRPELYIRLAPILRALIGELLAWAQTAARR